MAIKIYHLISSLKRGGRERQLATIVSYTDQDRFPSKVVYFNESEFNYIEEYNLSNNCIQIKSRRFLSRMVELNSLFNTEKPDVIYTWGNLESVFIILLNPFHRFKFVNGSIRHGIRSKKLSHYFRSFNLHISSNIVANSHAGLKANNLKRGNVLYNGIADKFIGLPAKETRRKARQQLISLNKDINVLISVANLVPYKDYFSILKALKIVKERGYRFLYLILGEGPLRENIEQLISDFNLSENVLMLGNVQEVGKYFKIADIFIHSSKGEGCSNAILEAMAAGLPIIASDTGGTAEIVDNKNGYLFEYKNVKQLTRLIVNCLDNTDEMKKMGLSSFEKINKEFTIDKMMQNYYRIIIAIVQ